MTKRKTVLGEAKAETWAGHHILQPIRQSGIKSPAFHLDSSTARHHLGTYVTVCSE